MATKAEKTDAQIKRELKSLANALRKAATRLDSLTTSMGKPAATAKKKATPKKKAAAKKKAAPKKAAKRAPVRKKTTAKKKAAPKKTAKSAPRNRVLGAIKKKKTGMKPADLVKSLKMNLKSVQNALHRLKQQGLITTSQRGVYVAK